MNFLRWWTTHEHKAEEYERTGNLHKSAQRYAEAGLAFENAAQAHEKAKCLWEAGKIYAAAALAYRQVDAEKALELYHKAASVYVLNGMHHRAAEMHKSAAEMLEKGREPDFLRSYLEYEKAAMIFDAEDKPSAAGTCLRQMAYLSVEMEEYTRAAELFLRVGQNALDVRVLRYSAQEYFFYAVLCQLVQDDLVAAKRTFQQFEAVLPQNREFELLRKVLECREHYDGKGISQAAFEYDNVKRLDDLAVRLLGKIREAANADDEESEDLL